MCVFIQDISLVEKELATVIPQNIIITISVTTTTTAGKTLVESDLQRVYAACDAIIGLDEAKVRWWDEMEVCIGVCVYVWVYV